MYGWLEQEISIEDRFFLVLRENRLVYYTHVSVLRPLSVAFVSLCCRHSPSYIAYATALLPKKAASHLVRPSRCQRPLVTLLR